LRCLFVFFSGQISAYSVLEKNEHMECIDVEQIYMEQDRIYVLSNGEIVPVAAILQEEEGVYAVKSTWTCPRCGTVNEWWRTKCQNCQY
jgi:hypothetical protein